VNLFYSSERSGTSWVLDEDEVRHLRVLRLNVGDELHTTDGKGKIYQCRIESVQKNKALLEELNSIEPKAPFKRLHIYLSPVKNPDRMEWMVEKLTEIGVGSIGFIETTHSERHHLKFERLQRKIISAGKQSLKGAFPELIPMQKLTDLLPQSGSGFKAIAHCYDTPGRSYLGNMSKTDEKITVLIGPEGDFTTEEVLLCVQSGFTEISLGDARLRTETAAVVAATLMNHLLI
jgi:16S rRNA (uracil1498-N3)-methyltransferase